MAKGNAAQKSPETNGEAKKFAAPVGYKKSSTNVDQFWVEKEGPIHGKLLGAKTYMNKKAKPPRPNKIYIFELLEPCRTATSKGEIFERPAEKGELVGVWGSPGMRELDGFGGCHVWMVRDGEKDVGQLQPMKTYEIVNKPVSPGAPFALRILAAPESVETVAGSPASDAADESDAIPF